jgi:hypothetical protein
MRQGRLILLLCVSTIPVAPISAVSTSALAEDAGRRDFPATLVVEEPQTETEFVPALATLKNADNARQIDFAGELSVQVTEPFAVVLGSAFSLLRPGGSGFQNFETTLKYQFIADAAHEFVLSAGLSTEWGGTGAQRVDADPFTTLTPTVYFGRGAGDLPENLAFLRPLALTGQVGLAIPTAGRSFLPDDVDPGLAMTRQNPYAISLAGSFQYSLPYAARNTPSVQVPGFAAKFVPLVEYNFYIPVARNDGHLATLGTINPGFLWCNGDVQIGVEALIPINRDSGRHPGVRVQLAYSFKTPWIAAAAASHEKPDHD